MGAITLNDEILVFPKNHVWETPATSYPLEKVRLVKIVRTTYKKGVYRMEGVNGYDYFELKSPIKVTGLKIRKEMVMVDDPLHWYGMQALAAHCSGNVLCSGLGLGLIYHALEKNTAVKSVDIIERNPDVIKLMRPHIPSKFNVIEQDLHEYIGYPNLIKKIYDCAVLDHWWGSSDREMRIDMMITRAKVMAIFPHANVYIWGVCNPAINPAIRTI